MILVFQDGTVQLKGKPAQILRMAIASIREEVGSNRTDLNIDDWECALAEFIAEDVRDGLIEDRARDQDINVKWRDLEFHYHVDGVQPDGPMGS